MAINCKRWSPGLGLWQLEPLSSSDAILVAAGLRMTDLLHDDNESLSPRSAPQLNGVIPAEEPFNNHNLTETQLSRNNESLRPKIYCLNKQRSEGTLGSGLIK